jgi:prepilin-type processing-associated H-X9-DG protein
LVGPKLKLTERRRMLCHNYLSMIGHAALLYQTEFGQAPRSLEMLEQTQCAPGAFGKGSLVCPDGGHYELAADGMTGVCSLHGRTHALTPCCEIPLHEVKGTEADAYQAFLREYNQYWRMYFDPIAMRLQINPKGYRLETIVLPLIDNSIYTGLSGVLGGQPEALDGLPVPRRNIFSVAARFNKEQLLRSAGLWDEVADQPGTPPVTPEERMCANNLKQIALACLNFESTYGKFPAVANFDKGGRPLLSWRVQLLPYFLGQQELYNQFHFNEAWDSEHNKKLIPRMPAIYRCPATKKQERGLTTYLAPVGKRMAFTGDATQIRLADIVDGTSNTILVVDASDERAVIWTKPDDFSCDPERPLAGLVGHHEAGFNVAFADGSVSFLWSSIDWNKLRALFTRNGGEAIELSARDERAPPSNAQNIFGYSLSEARELDVGTFLKKGVGDQIALHLYDATPLFDLNALRLLGMLFGSFNGGRADPFSSDLMIGFVVASLNTPAYTSIPVRDTAVVDAFLARLDKFLTVVARQKVFESDFLSIQPEFYRFPTDKKNDYRAWCIQFGPVKWRVFWARIGNGLYIASKPFILEDLAACAKTPLDQSGDQGPTAHAMLRLRPRNWDQVLADFRLGWAENNRQACLRNVGPLSSIARALTARPAGAAPGAVKLENSLTDLASHFLGCHCFCPEGGHYVLAEDGLSVSCSVHGSGLAPTQPAAPTAASTSDKLLRNFTGLTVSLTFLHDGLHAVVEVKR